jgi:hypothetical protein
MNTPITKPISTITKDQQQATTAIIYTASTIRTYIHNHKELATETEELLIEKSWSMTIIPLH